MNYFIITGTSRGIGEATARALIQKGNYLICISRKENHDLTQQARDQGVDIEYFSKDLSRIEEVEQLAGDIMLLIDRNNAERIALVNNAGLLEPIGPIHKLDTGKLLDHMDVNLLAPMILTSVFIRETQNLAIPKSIMNISSGAAQNPYYGWSAYCTGKAGIDMLTRTVAEEQKNAENPVKIFSFAPGIVATAMQDLIRTQKREDFAMVDKFIDLKKNHKLSDPAQVGEVIADTLFDPKVKQGDIIDIRDA
ncbi:MAG: (S)-benzoin forming benzil reductase [Bacteroidales bacterium]|nr:(S)-benzoin forming benzil reductase [Bacteroidales bacterium]